MIDWLNVFTNTIWLIGLAACMATLSYADWHAHATGTRLRSALKTPQYAPALYGGLALVGVGAALSSAQWWEQLVWALIALGAVVAGGRARGEARRE